MKCNLPFRGGIIELLFYQHACGAFCCVIEARRIEFLAWSFSRLAGLVESYLEEIG